MTRGNALFAPFYDFLIFFLPPLIAIPLFFQSRLDPGQLVLAVAFLAAMHQGSLWGLYLDPHRVESHLKQKLVYFWIPLLMIVPIVLIMAVSRTWMSLIFWTYTFHHVVRQNIGLLSLYRMKNPAPYHFKLENWAVYLVSWGGFLFRAPHIHLPGFVKGIAIALAVAGTVAALSALHRLKGHRARNAAVYFFVLACFYYGLFLLIPQERAELVLEVGLVIHYIQYLGLVPALQLNKTIRRFSLTTVVSFVVLAVLTLKLWPYMTWRYIDIVKESPLEFSIGSLSVSGRRAILAWVTFLHYYFDQYLWKVSNPEVRQHIVPYLGSFLASNRT